MALKVAVYISLSRRGAGDGAQFHCYLIIICIKCNSIGDGTAVGRVGAKIGFGAIRVIGFLACR